jgi:acyl-coenzyme A synthetase/AMP-(fatty) acid ligase
MTGDFLMDPSQGIKLSYVDFLIHLKRQTVFKPILRATDLLSFYTGLVLGIIHEKDIRLVDEDFLLPPDLANDENTTILLDKKKVEMVCQDMDSLVEHIQQAQSSLCLFTSGTTAIPKQINYPIGRLLRNIRLGPNYAASRWGLAYHPAHMAGLQVFMQAFLNKNLVVNLFKTSRKDCLALINSYQISHLSATPTFYRLLPPYESPILSVKKLSIGGERSSVRLHERLKAFFPNATLYNLFATTEAGTLFSSDGTFFGVPPHLERWVRFEDQELLLHRSLLADPDILRPGTKWYRTGDKIVWDKQGRFQFAGRKKDTVNVAGYRVKMIEIEEALEQIDGIQQFRVYSRSNAVTWQLICCEIKLLDKSLDIPQIKNRLKEKLQSFKVPRIIKIIDEIPLTYTGKIKK